LAVNGDVVTKHIAISEVQESNSFGTEPAFPKSSAAIGNMGKPIKLRDVRLSGFVAETALAGASVKICTRASMTSDQAVFHRMAANLLSVLRHQAQQVKENPALDSAEIILLVIRPDKTAELWVDAAAVINEMRLKRATTALSVVLESDIADLTGMWFPSVDISPNDQIVVVFREGFRFGLFFDFNADGVLNIEQAKRDLGTLVRKMRFADHYSVLESNVAFRSLVDAGWFPFIEILGDEFRVLSDAGEVGFLLDAAETDLVKKFSHERLDRMFERWMSKPHFKDKEAILHAGVEAYKEGKWVSCIKIILTEREGVIAEAYFTATGNRTRDVKRLLDFMVNTASKTAGGKDTLFFPSEFAEYLRQYTYADSEQQCASRHAVGHGRAMPEHYTSVRALQALLTLDQFAFYA
jgi:hypothetical protein